MWTHTTAIGNYLLCADKTYHNIHNYNVCPMAVYIYRWWTNQFSKFQQPIVILDQSHILFYFQKSLHQPPATVLRISKYGLFQKFNTLH